MKIITRAGWKARKPRKANQVYTVPWSARMEFFVHHTDGPRDQTIKSIQDFHQGPSRGWNDIGYNFLIDEDGTIFEGRGWTVVGAHCPGHNRTGISAAFIGSNNPTVAVKRAIRWLYEEACQRAGRALLRLGHGQRFATSCPGKVLQKWVNDGMPVDEPAQEPIELVWKNGVPAFAGRVLTYVEDPMMYGDDVKAMQEKLKRRGWKLDVDRWYGPKTRGVIRLFQARTGLPVTGTVDRVTWDMIWSWRPPTVPGQVDATN